MKVFPEPDEISYVPGICYHLSWSASDFLLTKLNKGRDYQEKMKVSPEPDEVSYVPGICYDGSFRNSSSSWCINIKQHIWNKKKWIADFVYLMVQESRILPYSCGHLFFSVQAIYLTNQ